MKRGKAMKGGSGREGCNQGNRQWIRVAAKGEAVKKGGSERQLRWRSNERESVEGGTKQRERPQTKKMSKGRRH